MIIYPSKIMVMKLKDFVDVQAMNMLFFQGQGSTKPYFCHFGPYSSFDKDGFVIHD